MAVAEHRRQRRVEGPAGVHPAEQQRQQGEQAATQQQVTTEQVQARKGHVFGTNHDWHQEITEHARNRRNQEKPHHDHPVQGKRAVVAIGSEQIPFRRDQFDADQARRQPAGKEKEGHGEHVQHRNTFVIAGQQP